MPEFRTRDEMQGYFLSISRNRAEIIRNNYKERPLAGLDLTGNRAFNDNVSHLIEIDIKLNRIIVKIDKEMIFDIFDYEAFAGGRVGLYSVNTQITASNFKYTEY
jgi:hypothetical protein